MNSRACAALFLRRLPRHAGAWIALLLSACAATTDAGAPTDPACALSHDVIERNRSLSWEQFDLEGAIPGTAMWFTGRGCYAAAAAAGEDYLVRGPLLGERARAATVLHVARNLAMAGDEHAAARVAAAARRSDQAPDAALNWNAYVEGVHAFLTRDRGGLEAAYGRLHSLPGPGNAINAANLDRLRRCFERSYRAAMEEEVCTTAER